MPHIIIEYSANAYSATESRQVTRLAHEAAIQSGLFTPRDIKTRSYVTEDFQVGEKGQDGSFAHITVYLLEGRTIEQKKGLSDALHSMLQAHVPHVDCLSVDIQDMTRECYRK